MYNWLFVRLSLFQRKLIDLSKQQVLDADPRENQQTNFTTQLERAEITTRFLVFEKGKETVKRIFTRRCKSFVNVL